MLGWTAERVQQLTPDASSAKAGQGLAAARYWVSSGIDDDALWGECRGSGTTPYQVRIDLAEPAFKCSCPSRKFPCKHSIGLMLMMVAGTLRAGTRPAWVVEWFADRTARAAKKQAEAEAPSKTVDADVQQKRRQERLESVGAGLRDLKLWLHDLSRAGLASVPSRGDTFFDDQARRLVDAQAPGVARRVRSMAGVPATGAGWQLLFLERISSLYLLVRAFERRDVLPAAARELVLSVVGISQSQEEVLGLPPVPDRWEVFAREVAVEDRLRVQHTWLLGQRTKTLAHVVTFAHGAQPFDVTLPAGFAFEGEVCFYPGDGLRVLVKSKGGLAAITSLAYGVDVDSLYDQYATRRSVNPWIEGFAAVLSSVVPTRSGDGWLVNDAHGRALELIVPQDAAWRLLAVSGGRPLDLAVYFNGRCGRPLAACVAGELLQFGAAVEGEAA